jgi:hypothetical protein
MNIIRMVLTRLNLKPLFSGFYPEKLNAAHRMALAVIPVAQITWLAKIVEGPGHDTNDGDISLDV